MYYNYWFDYLFLYFVIDVLKCILLIEENFIINFILINVLLYVYLNLMIKVMKKDRLVYLFGNFWFFFI